jgi:hypothetical protein
LDFRFENLALLVGVAAGRSSHNRSSVVAFRRSAKKNFDLGASAMQLK